MVTLTAACSSAAHQAGSKAPSTVAEPPSATPAVTAPPSTPPSPVATVTAACPLLPADELKALLGGAKSQTTVTATESAPDISQGFKTYDCTYGSGGKQPYDLAVTTTNQDFTPKEGVDSIAKGSHIVLHDVTSVGQAGKFFTDSDGNSLIAVAKVSHGETRTVIFSAPAVVPEQNFINLAKVVLDRI